MEFKIPKALQFQQDFLLATKMPFIHIEPFVTDEVIAPWTSKYRGLPYLPRYKSYPQGADGRPLNFLAQINFSEVPKLKGYPTAGVLQFFIGDDNLYGMSYNCEDDADEQFKRLQQQTNFRVIYYSRVVEDCSFLNTTIELPKVEYTPLYEQCELKFSLQEGLISTNDYQFERQFGEYFHCSLSDEESQKIWAFDAASTSSNRIGGHPYFITSDIRAFAPPDEKWLLLLQMDHTDNADILWGANGLGYFFIEEKALQALDFSRVLYNWD